MLRIDPPSLSKSINNSKRKRDPNIQRTISVRSGVGVYARNFVKWGEKKSKILKMVHSMGKRKRYKKIKMKSKKTRKRSEGGGAGA